jgi:8-amino-7-oxononanoate synthase
MTVSVPSSRQRPAGPSSEPGEDTSPLERLLQSIPAYRQLQQRKAAVLGQGLSIPYFRLHEDPEGAEVVVEGRRRLNFSRYDYLGLAKHAEVRAAAKQAVDRYGTSVAASRIVSGEIPLHRELEDGLAEVLGVEAAMVFISGYGANVSVIGHLMGPRDLILLDGQVHNSIRTGARLSGARTLTFGHNDVERLDRLLANNRAKFERILIIVEGVYSMEGDIAELPAIVALKKRHGALLMVDEAHSFGVLGDSGFGVGEHFGLAAEDIDIRMGTLSKALGASGGYIAGDSKLIDYLKFTAPGFLFSVALPPAETAAALAALGLLRREPERAARLRAKSALFLDRARALGLDTETSAGTPIVPVVIGHPHRCLQLAGALFEEGIDVFPILPPGVSDARSRLRFFITVDHADEQLAAAVETVARLLAEIVGAE